MWARSARSPKSYSADKPCPAETHRNGRLACHQKPSYILCTSTHWLCFAKIAWPYLTWPCLKGLAPHIPIGQHLHRMALSCKYARQSPPSAAASVSPPSDPLALFCKNCHSHSH